MLEIIQVAASLIPLVGVLVLLRKNPDRVIQNLLLSNIGCLAMNVGYFLELQSSSEEAVVLAWRISYLGNALFYFYFVFFILDYLRFRYPRWFRTAWACIEVAGVVCMLDARLMAVMMGEAMEWNLLRGLPQTETNIVYSVRYGILCLLLVFGFVDTLIRLFGTRLKKERRNLGLLTIAQLVVLVSQVVRMSVPMPFNVVPLLAAFSLVSIIFYVIRGEFFTVADTGREWVFEHIEDAFVIVDAAYGYLDSNVYANRIFTELPSYRKNKLVSEPLYGLFFSPEKQVQLGERYYERTVTPLNQGKEIVGYCLLLVDVTETHQLMEELVVEKERAESASRAKSAFLSNMSHEIRTPMNAVVGMTELLLREEHSAKETGYLRNIKNSGLALLTIINDILDFSKIESGKLEIIEEEYAPASMLSDLKMIFQNRIGEKKIELQFDIDRELPRKLYGDSMRLRQIIINIVNNAIKFTEQGYVRLTVKVQETSGEDVRLFFSVRDTGQGIRAEDLKKLFGAFEQVDIKKNRKKEGTGLGLAISKQLVGLMGGEIGVTSEYGQGSEFYFTVCQKQRSAETVGDDWEEAVFAEKEAPEDYQEFTAPDASILIVEDNEINREVAVLLLEPLNMQIDTAENGAEALDKVQKKHYDLVLMDHWMPVMNGVEATQAIRRLEGEEYRKLPILALTADALAEAKEEFLAAGMNDFVAKPIEIKELCAKLKQWLPKERTSADRRAASDGRGEEGTGNGDQYF